MCFLLKKDRKRRRRRVWQRERKEGRCSGRGIGWGYPAFSSRRREFIVDERKVASHIFESLSSLTLKRILFSTSLFVSLVEWCPPTANEKPVKEVWIRLWLTTSLNVLFSLSLFLGLFCWQCWHRSAISNQWPFILSHCNGRGRRRVDLSCFLYDSLLFHQSVLSFRCIGIGISSVSSNVFARKKFGIQARKQSHEWKMSFSPHWWFTFTMLRSFSSFSSVT